MVAERQPDGRGERGGCTHCLVLIQLADDAHGRFLFLSQVQVTMEVRSSKDYGLTLRSPPGSKVAPGGILLRGQS